MAGRLVGGPRSSTGGRRGMTPLCDEASYSIECENSWTFLTWACLGPFAHLTRSPASPGTMLAPPIFLGFVQFSVCVFSASTFPENPPEVEKCHFAELPEVPTDTADLTNGIPGRPRTRTATVRKLARLARRLRPP